MPVAVFPGLAAVIEDLVGFEARPVAFGEEGLQMRAGEAVDIEGVDVVGSGVGLGALWW